MQQKYPMMKKLEVELTQEMEIENIPDRPSKLITISKTYVIQKIHYSFKHLQSVSMIAQLSV